MDTADRLDPRETLDELHGLVKGIYRTMFALDIATKQHAFLEWCGVMREHVNMLRDAHEDGHDITHLNQHGSANVRPRKYRILYLGEKLRCILAPFIDNDPEMRELLFSIIRGSDERGDKCTTNERSHDAGS